MLSASDLQHLDQTVDRVQRFSALTGGRDLAIVFLLNTPSPTGPIDSVNSLAGVYAYTKLQTEMVHNAIHIPTLPVANLEGIPRLLEKHVAALKSTTKKQPPRLASSVDLLQLCTVEPMSQQTGFMLSDLFPNLSELAAACSSVTSAPNSSSPSARASGLETSTQSSYMDPIGKLKTLRDLAGDQACRNIVDFWKEEWTVY